MDTRNSPSRMRVPRSPQSTRSGPLRQAATTTRLPALVVIRGYAGKIDTLLNLDDQVAVGSSDSTLANGVRVAGLVSAMKEQASEEQALITAAQSSSLIGLNPGGFSAGIQQAITTAAAQQQANEAEFNSTATASQRQLFDSALSAPTVDGAQAQVQQAASLTPNAPPGAEDPVIANAESSLERRGERYAFGGSAAGELGDRSERNAAQQRDPRCDHLGRSGRARPRPGVPGHGGGRQVHDPPAASPAQWCP